jgi:hypothetical protein
MPSQVDLYNQSLQVLGTRTTVTAAQIAGNLSNEAIQLNIIYDPTRRRLLRMAPWNCAFNTINLTMITAVFGTPENTSAATNVWQKGQPAPPYAYSYLYPPDCLRACWITPQTATGFAGGVPITTAVTGGAPSFWQGPPVKFKTAVDQFLVVTAATPVANGSHYAVGDQIVVALQPAAAITTNILGTFQIGQPQGAAAVLQVTSVGVSGTVTGVSLVGQTLNVNGVQTPTTGAYYYANTDFAAQASTSGLGGGATFALTFSGPQTLRVILTNQEFAILNYVTDVSDVNVFDDLFTEAFTKILGAEVAMALKGDKKAAALAVQMANDSIGRARQVDGNEGLTVNDVVPDWLRTRGINYIEDYSGPYNTGFDWGALWPGYT